MTYLISKCAANPNTEGHNKYNALQFAVMGKRAEIAEYLLMNTLVNYKNKDSKGRKVESLIQELMPEYYDPFLSMLDHL